MAISMGRRERLQRDGWLPCAVVLALVGVVPGCGSGEDADAAGDSAADAASADWLWVVDAGGGTSRILRVRPDGTGMETVLDPAPDASRGIVLDASSGARVRASATAT